MNADHLCHLIVRSLTVEAEIAAVERTSTIYMDRRALRVTDVDGCRWRMHVMTEPTAPT